MATKVKDGRVAIGVRTDASFADLMTRRAITVTGGTPVRDAARLMHRNRIKQLPVIDSVTGRIAGTVHQGDLLRVFTWPSDEIPADTEEIAQELDVDMTELTLTISGAWSRSGERSATARRSGRSCTPSGTWRGSSGWTRT
jgi:CBS-domain-containing membrane protein